MSHQITPDSWHIYVRKTRKEQGITQKRLAQMTGIRQPRISQIENGVVDPKLSEIHSMAKVLGLAMTVFPERFTELVEFTIDDCLILEEQKYGPRTIPELILGDRAYQ